MSLRKYWVNRHSMVGEHDSLRTTTDIPMYLACDIDAALREAKAQTFDDVREAQAVWQDDRGEFYRLYRCDTFDEWCLSEQRKLLEDKP